MLSLLGFVLLASPPPPSPTPTPVPTPGRATVRRATGAAAESLAEVAARTRLRSPQGRVKITNENLRELAGNTELTTASPAPQAAGTPWGGGEGGPEREAALQRQWQQRYQAARGYLRYLEDQEGALVREVERLKNEFYALDDPFRRDGVVKPAWDEAIAKLAETRAQLAKARTLPDEVMQAALKEGALPGWFRGLPEPAPVSSPPTVEPSPPGTPRVRRPAGN